MLNNIIFKEIYLDNKLSDFKYSLLEKQLENKSLVNCSENSHLTTIQEIILNEQSLTDVYYKKGSALFGEGQCSQAKEAFEDCLSLQRKLCQGEDILVADLYEELGLIYRYEGDLEMSLFYFYKSLEIRAANYGDDHVMTAKSLKNIGLVHHQKFETRKALDFFTKALQMEILSLGSVTFELGVTHYSIARAYKMEGNLIESLNHCQKALNIFLKTKTDTQQEIAKFYIFIAEIYQTEYQIRNSIRNSKYHSQPNVKFEHSSDELLTEEDKIFETEDKQCLEKALSYFKKCLKSDQNGFLKIGTDLESVYDRIGKIYHEQGKYTKALNAYTKSLMYQMKKENKKPLMLTTTYYNIGLIYIVKLDPKAALKNLHTSLKLFQSQSQSQIQQNISVFQNDPASSFPFKSADSEHYDVVNLQCLHDKNYPLTPRNPTLSDIYNALGTVYCNMQDIEKGAEYYSKGFEVRMINSKFLNLN